jgi:hypothetical protein
MVSSAGVRGGGGGVSGGGRGSQPGGGGAGAGRGGAPARTSLPLVHVVPGYSVDEERGPAVLLGDHDQPNAAVLRGAARSGAGQGGAGRGERGAAGASVAAALGPPRHGGTPGTHRQVLDAHVPRALVVPSALLIQPIHLDALGVHRQRLSRHKRRATAVNLFDGNSEHAVAGVGIQHEGLNNQSRSQAPRPPGGRATLSRTIRSAGSQFFRECRGTKRNASGTSQKRMQQRQFVCRRACPVCDRNERCCRPVVFEKNIVPPFSILIAAAPFALLLLSALTHHKHFFFCSCTSACVTALQTPSACPPWGPPLFVPCS